MPKILICDDSAAELANLRSILMDAGWHSVTASNGAEAVQKASAEKPALIFLDIIMPDMDGYEATRQIRARQSEAGHRRTPIIGLSARAMEGDRETALFAGLDDYLTKPLRQDQLEAAFERWIPVNP